MFLTEFVVAYVFGFDIRTLLPIIHSRPFVQPPYIFMTTSIICCIFDMEDNKHKVGFLVYVCDYHSSIHFHVEDKHGILAHMYIWM